MAALFPEIPVDAERQVLGLGLIVGALVFSALMGWGPLGQWLANVGSPTSVSAAALVRPSGSGGISTLPSVDVTPVTTPIVDNVAETTVPEATVPETTVANTTVAEATVTDTVAATEPTVTATIAAASVPVETTEAIAAPVADTAPTTIAASLPIDVVVEGVNAAGDPVPEGLTLYFGNGQATPLDGELDKINAIVDTLKTLPDGAAVEIVGHASPNGNPAANQALSLRRATSVVEALKVALGSSADRLRLSTKAKGGSDAVGDPAKSRRVTIDIVAP